VSPNAPFLAPERDSAFKIGRAKKSGTTYYTIPGVGMSGALTAVAITINTDFYHPIFVQTPIIVDILAISVTSAGASSNTRFGYYAANTDWQPVGAPLADSGDVSTGTTGVKTYTPGTPLFMPRGRYVSVINSDTAQPTLTAHYGMLPNPLFDTTIDSGTVTEMTVGRTHAAFPTPGTAWTTVGTGTQPIKYPVFFRVLTP